MAEKPRPSRDPEDQAPKKRPVAKRAADGRVVRQYPISYGQFKAVLIEREHPATKKVTLSLAPKRRTR
jgi:hypothetical protein